MTPEQLTEQLQAALPNGLRSVVLYGSAAAGDFVEGASNYNVLVVVDRLTVAELDALSKPAVAWTRDGNHAPMLFTAAELAASADAFPIELLDIQQSHKVLLGDDPVANIVVRPENLRLQLEHELKGKLLTLRQRYLLTRGKPNAVLRLMSESLSTFLVLFRAALRLYQEKVPTKKLDALDELAARITVDPRPFRTIHGLKRGAPLPADTTPQALFSEYLAAIERIVDAVDRHLHHPTTGN